MVHFQSSNPKDALKLLNERLKKGIPCVLSVNSWEHWMTVINYTKGKYVFIDSENEKVIGIKTPAQLTRYWKYADKYENIISYDGYAIVPKFRMYTKAKFTPEKAKQIMYKKNEKLAKKWDQYFNDLISVCRPRTKLTMKMITFGEFLRRNEESLVTKVADWHGMPSYSEIKKVLQNMKIVADIYDLIIPLEEEKKALVDITSLLMMYACGKYGMDTLY